MQQLKYFIFGSLGWNLVIFNNLDLFVVHIVILVIEVWG